MANGEREFLLNYHKEDYDRPSVAVDLVLFTLQNGKLTVFLQPREEHPYQGVLALPGTFVDTRESIDDAVRRCLLQKIRLDGIYFEQLYTFGAVDRDPRMRIISVAYYALVSADKLLEMDPTGDVLTHFYPVCEMDFPLAFDHRTIVECGVARIAGKAEYTDIAFELLPADFTLPQLQAVYEILLGKPLYKANFRKKIADKIVATDRMTAPDGHRPSQIYNKKPAPEVSGDQ